MSTRVAQEGTLCNDGMWRTEGWHKNGNTAEGTWIDSGTLEKSVVGIVDAERSGAKQQGVRAAC